MPRTKLNRGVNNKRARDNNSEIEDILRDFDIDVDAQLQHLRSMQRQLMEDIDNEMEDFKMQLGPRVLKLTMGELKSLKDLDDVNKLDKTMSKLNQTMKEVALNADDGYITEEACNKSRLTADSVTSDKPANVSTIAPLRTIQKNRRRSQSASNIPSTSYNTPGPRSMMHQMKMKTPLTKSNSDIQKRKMLPHASRSRYKTPLQKTGQRAISADRVDTIVPKVNPMTPISVLRHARVGEIAFSVSGSPIVPSNIVESTANVNIPIPNGVLSIRPQNMDPAQLDSSLFRNIDTNTVDHLRTLKSNLDLLMKKFENRMCL